MGSPGACVLLPTREFFVGWSGGYHPQVTCERIATPPQANPLCPTGSPIPSSPLASNLSLQVYRSGTPAAA